MEAKSRQIKKFEMFVRSGKIAQNVPDVARSAVGGEAYTILLGDVWVYTIIIPTNFLYRIQ